MNQPQGALSRRLAVLRRPPLVCVHSWIESESVPGFFECEKCSGVYYYEPDQAAGNDDGDVIHADCDDCGAPGILRPGDTPYCASCWAKRCGHGTLLRVPCAACQLIAVGGTRMDNRLTPAEWDRLRTRNLLGRTPTRLPSRLGTLGQ